MSNLQKVITGENDFTSGLRHNNYRFLKELIIKGKRERSSSYHVNYIEAHDMACDLAEQLPEGVSLQQQPKKPGMLVWLLITVLIAVAAAGYLWV